MDSVCYGYHVNFDAWQILVYELPKTGSADRIRDKKLIYKGDQFFF